MDQWEKVISIWLTSWVHLPWFLNPFCILGILLFGFILSRIFVIAFRSYIYREIDNMTQDDWDEVFSGIGNEDVK